MSGHEQLSLQIIGGPTGALTTIACLIIVLILLKIGRKVSTCEIISQSDYSFNSYDQKSKCSMYVYH